jgi:hypothetical protein
MSLENDVNRFKSELELFFQDYEKDIKKEVVDIARTIQEEVIYRTRIKTGRAKASWHVELGGPNFDVDPSIDDDDRSTWISAGEALGRAQRDLSDLERLRAGPLTEANDIYISNGVSYIVKLENADSMAEGTIQWAASFLPITVTGLLERG